MKILSRMYLWTKESILNFGSHPVSEFGFALAEVCTLRYSCLWSNYLRDT